MIQIASTVDTEIAALEARLADLKTLKEAEAQVKALREKVFPPLTSATVPYPNSWQSGSDTRTWTKGNDTVFCYSVK